MCAQVCTWANQDSVCVCVCVRRAFLACAAAGDLLADCKERLSSSHSTTTPAAKPSTRSLLSNCPWMELTQPSGVAADNRLTVHLFTVAWCASKQRLQDLLPKLNAAVCTAFGVPSQAAVAKSVQLLASSAAQAADPAGATAALASTNERQGVLAAAALRAMRVCVAESPAKFGRLRHMLQHGAAVTLDALGKSAGAVLSGWLGILGLFLHAQSYLYRSASVWCQCNSHPATCCHHTPA